MELLHGIATIAGFHITRESMETIVQAQPLYRVERTILNGKKTITNRIKITSKIFIETFC